MVKVTPPGTLRATPTLLHQQVVQRAPSPPPPYQSSSAVFGFDPDESDEDSEDDVVIAPKSDRSLVADVTVPQFWGVVRVSDFNGVTSQEGLERDNAMRNMLSRNAYLSRASNAVYVAALVAR